MMKTVLVTGSNGFIGQVLSQELQALGFSVKNLVRTKTAKIPNQLVLDLTAEWSFNPCDGVDTVFHLAGKAHALAEVTQDNDEYQKINTEATEKLLNAAQQAGVQQFIYFSSVKAIGDSELRQDETSTLAAESPYGQSKLAAEKLVLKENYVPHPVVIRPCMVYGNSHKGNLPKMIQAIARGVFPPLPEVNNQRSMVHVNDVVSAALLAAEKSKAAKQIYIVSDGEGYSSRQLYEWICYALKKPIPSLTIPLIMMEILAKIGDVIGRCCGRRFIFDSNVKHKLLGSACYSSVKIEKELGFKARYSVQQALPDIVSYLQKEGFF
ncbi:MAG: NAD-dependent epimerase/dehydratase family protein [Methylococcales bacterium]|nr:NAD-dependent epimerase/dehydratase family protein [Methylococcales bacterium]MCK5926504.1 NAD-dependent epimerase/dehydratase family protein [Methylococcales bacterium]